MNPTNTEEEQELELGTDPEQEEEAPLNAFMLSNGFPMFLGEVDDIIERVGKLENPSYSIFYVLGSYKATYETTTSGSKTITHGPPEPRLFKIINNFIGTSIDTVDDDALGFTEIKPTASMSLPKIPFELIQKLDQFFRAVDDKQKTEAICMLTYDPRIGGEAGWGVLVPEQHNNSSHCNYKPESIIDDKDDEVVIVGSAHSHPGMSAFASHTDHGDQSDFDGIHITFGWKFGSKKTEHYIELQMGGTAYVMEEHVAFTDAPEPPKFEVVDSWIGKVNKQSYAPGFSMGQSPSGKQQWNNTATGTTSNAWTHFDTSRDGNSNYDSQNRKYTLPEGCPDPDANTVIVRVTSEDEKKCPICLTWFTNKEITERRRCWNCYSYLILPNESLEEMIAFRDQKNAPTWELIPEHANRSIYMFERWVEEEDGKEVVKSSIDIYHQAEPGKE